MVKLSRHLRRRLRHFIRDGRAVSAVEFAFIFPVMLTIYIGGSEVGNGLTISREVSHVASTIGDLVSQCSSISNTDMSNILGAAAYVITPYSTGNLTIRVSGITTDASSNATVTWSDQYQSTALTTGASYTLPAALRTASSFYVATEVHYSYRPYIGYVMTGTYDISHTLYFAPRDSTSISRTSSTTSCNS
jgi:Flp pilus assembly protein TadG